MSEQRIKNRSESCENLSLLKSQVSSLSVGGSPLARNLYHISIHSIPTSSPGPRVSHAEGPGDEVDSILEAAISRNSKPVSFLERIPFLENERFWFSGNKTGFSGSFWRARSGVCTTAGSQTSLGSPGVYWSCALGNQAWYLTVEPNSVASTGNRRR